MWRAAAKFVLYALKSARRSANRELLVTGLEPPILLAVPVNQCASGFAFLNFNALFYHLADRFVQIICFEFMLSLNNPHIHPCEILYRPVLQVDPSSPEHFNLIRATPRNCDAAPFRRATAHEDCIVRNAVSIKVTAPVEGV